MAPKRGDSSRKKKEDVRFIVINPKPSGRMKLRIDCSVREGPVLPVASGRRLGRWRASSRISPSQANPRHHDRSDFICAGLAMMILGVRNGKWLLVLLGPFSISYGIAWVWVAHDGRLPGGRLRLNPWNRG